jgi:hypothetical protein
MDGSSDEDCHRTFIVVLCVWKTREFGSCEDDKLASSSCLTLAGERGLKGLDGTMWPKMEEGSGDRIKLGRTEQDQPVSCRRRKVNNTGDKKG